MQDAEVFGDRLSANCFDVVVSLGQACDASFQIRRTVGQSASYPFDWLITPFGGIRTLLRSNFTDLLDESVLEHENHYVLNKNHGIKFLHDFHDLPNFRKDLPAVREKYQRRIYRFLELMRGDKRVLLLRSQQYVNAENIDMLKATELIGMMKETYRQQNLHLLVVNPTRAMIPNQRCGDVTLLQADEPVPFVWSGNDLAWDAIMQKISLAPRSSVE
jgi:hypothetical protein